MHPRPAILVAIFLPATLVMVGVVGFRILQYQRLEQIEKQQKALLAQQEIQIPLFKEDPISGDKKAGKTIVAFADLACESCAAQHDLLTELIAAHPGRVKVVWKLLPVTTIPVSSKLAHQYALCANSQKQFDAFAQMAFANRPNLSKDILETIVSTIGLDKEKTTACISAPATEVALEQNETLARALQIQAVPTFFIDNTQTNPPSTQAGWETVLGL